jgi:hypothetical protein
MSQPIVEEVDQRDIQRRGGHYSKYPTSHVVCSLLKQHGLKRVLDVTYGQGRFYYLCRNSVEVIAVDPVKWDWVVYPKAFYKMNVYQLYSLVRDGKLVMPSADAVVVDPPRWYVTTYKRDMYNYLIGTPMLIIEYASKTAVAINAGHLLVHYRELIPINGFNPVHAVKFKFYTRYLKQDGNNMSWFILYARNR